MKSAREISTRADARQDSVTCVTEAADISGPKRHCCKRSCIFTEPHLTLISVKMSKRWVGNARDRKFSYARTRQWHKDHAPYECCKGKHIVITGGCSGIGLELAREAIHRDAKAVSLIDLTDASEKLLRDLSDEAADALSAVFLCKISAFKADVSDFDQAGPHSRKVQHDRDK